jgi:hypothetical protein
MKTLSLSLRAFVLAVLAILFVNVGAFAQKGNEGELDDVEIDIVKERQITLPKANRNFEKVPPKPSEPIKPPIQYDFRPFTFQTPQINPAIRPLKLKDQSSGPVYGGNLSAGYGNYASPYLEGFINSKRDKNKLVGAHAFLNASGKGPVDGKNSGSGTSGLSVYGKSFSDVVSLSGDVGFENRTTHFYGYDPAVEVDAKNIVQSYNVFKLGGALSNTKNTGFAYRLGAGFSYLADHYKARETEADIDFNSSYKVSDASSIGIKAGYYAISRKDALIEAKPRNLFTVNPTYVFYPVEDLKFSAGIVVAVEDDSIDNKNVHAYPDLRASYPLSPSVEVVASLSGGIEKVSLQSLSRENLWVAANIPVFHTNKLYDLQVALNTRIGNKVAVNGGLSFASLKNWYFYVNTPADQSKFTPVYDLGSVQRTNFFASLGYSQTNTVKLLLRGDLYAYGADDYNFGTYKMSDVWHRPTYKVMGEANFNIYQKVLLSVNLITQGGMKAPKFTSATTYEVMKLAAAFDLNAKVEYILSDRFSVFVQANNITSNQYPVFMNYPVRGLQVLGGLTWSF